MNFKIFKVSQVSEVWQLTQGNQGSFLERKREIGLKSVQFDLGLRLAFLVDYKNFT